MFLDLWVQILSNRILMQGGIDPNQTIRPLGDVDLETSWYMASLGNGDLSIGCDRRIVPSTEYRRGKLSRQSMRGFF